jgi:hypothetical protein
VVHPNTGHPEVGRQVHRLLVGSPEDSRILHPDADQTVNVEEAPIVPFLVADLPIGRPEVLPFQQVDPSVVGDRPCLRRDAGWVEREGLPVQEHSGRTVDLCELHAHLGQRTRQRGYQYPILLGRPINIEDRRVRGPAP